MSELPSLSKEIDKHLTAEVVPGEVNEVKGHWHVTFAITEREAANTPPPDLWAFYIVPCLRALADRINQFKKVSVRRLAVARKGTPGVIGCFISADGKIPVRLTIVAREPNLAFNNEGHYLYIIDTLFQEAE